MRSEDWSVAEVFVYVLLSLLDVDCVDATIPQLRYTAHISCREVWVSYFKSAVADCQYVWCCKDEPVNGKKTEAQRKALRLDGCISK